MVQKRTYVVEPEAAGFRLDRFLTKKNPNMSRSQVQQQIAKGAVLLNGKTTRAGVELKAGVEISVNWEDVQLHARVLTPAPLPLDILYEDAHVVVVNKAPNVAVHPGAGTRSTTLVEGLLWYCGIRPDQFGANHDLRPGVVHRLDKGTSGVMVWAKTLSAEMHLKAQFKRKQTKRCYVALLDAYMPMKEIECECLMMRDTHHRQRYTARKWSREDETEIPKGARLAKATFTRVETYGERLSLVKVRLGTGRTHQVRVQARFLGWPVAGDQLYHRALRLSQRFGSEARRAAAVIMRQMLHAELLGFIHPQSGAEVRFTAQPPTDFRALLTALQPYRDDVPE